MKNKTNKCYNFGFNSKKYIGLPFSNIVFETLCVFEETILNMNGTDATAEKLDLDFSASVVIASLSMGIYALICLLLITYSTNKNVQVSLVLFGIVCIVYLFSLF